MNNQEILDNAPEGATHFLTDDTNSIVYFAICNESYEIMFFTERDHEWQCQFDSLNEFTRSLADIKRIAELERALELAESNLHDEHLEYYEAELTALKEQSE